MSENNEYLSGIILGSVIALIIISLLVYAVMHKNKEADEFDERQVAIRGKAFQIGFFTAIIYNFIYGMSLVVFRNAYIEQTTAFILGIIVAIGVFAVYCIWNDAYVALNRNPKQFIIILAALGGLNLVIGIQGIMTGDIYENGMLCFRSLNLFIGVLAVILLITFVLKRFVKSEEE